MSLKCKSNACKSEIVPINNLIFRQDAVTGGWNLALTPELTERMPKSIMTRENDKKYVDVHCTKCFAKVAVITKVNGFEDFTANFSSKRVNLFANVYDKVPVNRTVNAKWKDLLQFVPRISQEISKMKSSSTSTLTGITTIHYQNLSEIKQMISAGQVVAEKSGLQPRSGQWRSFFFACLNNTLLVLPTGSGKTLIAELLMKAYREVNPKQIQVFVVPTIVLVEQQAASIERNTGLKVVRRSGEHGDDPWKIDEICTCTPAMLLQAFEFNRIAMSQISLLVLDEAHEANKESSNYGKVINKLADCLKAHRPRILALTASPSGTNSTNVEEVVENLCRKLFAVPYTPEQHSDDLEKLVNCNYIKIYKTEFEMQYEKLVFEVINKTSNLHNFFAQNIGILNEQSTVTCKVDTVVKYLNEAKISSILGNDIKLLQISMFMKKWIDSLDFLRIFGPRRLLQDIVKDLNFSTLNENLSEILSSLKDIIKFVRDQISTLNKYFGHESDSSRVSNLLTELKKHLNSQTRILIFVEKRFTAERLCRRLQEDESIKSMNPHYIFGNSAGDFPKELQEEILKKFSKGETRLLVATSVLEQGIDVASCGVVICYDGIKSLKSIIQSRGRARQKLANFVIFVSSENTGKVNSLSNLENVMNYVVKSLMMKHNSKFDAAFEQEISKFLRGEYDDLMVNHNDDDDLSDADDFDYDEDDDDTNYLSIKFTNFKKPKPLIELLERIDHNCRLKASKKTILAHFPIAEETVIKDDSQLSWIVRSLNELAKDSPISAWLETPLEYFDRHVNFFRMEFDLLTGFYFKNPNTVELDQDIIGEGEIGFKLSQTGIRLIFGLNNEFLINRCDMDEVVIIYETNSELMIFLCLKNPPKFLQARLVHFESPDSPEIRHSFAPFDFTDRSFNLCLKRLMPSNKMNEFRNALSSMSLRIYDAINLKIEYVGRKSMPIISDFNRDYMIKCWMTQNASVLPNVLPKSIIKELLAIPTDQICQLILENTTPSRFASLQLAKYEDKNLPLFDGYGLDLIHENYMRIGRVRVTPSRRIFLEKVPAAKNRIFRYFPNEENFIIVEFYNETEGNPWWSQDCMEFFLKTMMTGFNVGGRNYSFLGCSNSQLREGRCWFSCLNRNEVYQKIGDLSHFTNPGRKLTRLALAFASSFETVTVNPEYLDNVHPDIESGKICFSDGIGRASKQIFQQITKIMNLPKTPSAFQIRVGGVKGVISMFDQEEDVYFRKSMKKFNSDHVKLEVLNYSTSTYLYLNRHVILMLSSFGVPDEIFLQLQQNEIVRCMESLTTIDDESKLGYVSSISKIFDWQRFDAKLVTREPFFQQIMLNQVVESISELVNHARIKIEKGRVLMGVLDEFGILDYGEIYASVNDESLNTVIEGQVVIFRNPCVLPSDVRVLTARSNVPEFFKQMYKNVVVIPQKGRDSHARECAGGDLDGDLYYIIWDENLIPPSLTPPGRDVIEVNTREYHNDDNSASDTDMMKFYCLYQNQNHLGKIANAHLAVSDKHGIESGKAIELARFVVAETDAPKKGYTVGQGFISLIPKEYPHYMRKFDKVSFRSETVLGELFDQAFNILEILLEKQPNQAPKVKWNSANDTKSIKFWYSAYCMDIVKLIRSFDLTSEVDLFSGAPIWKKNNSSDFKKRITAKIALDDSMRIFWQKWENIFEDWRGTVGNDQKEINNWYNHPKSQLWPSLSFSFLALPFVKLQTMDIKSTIEHLHRSTKAWISMNKISWMTEWNKRKSVGETLLKNLQFGSFYGSSMLGLSEDFSDIDLYTAENLDSVYEKLAKLDRNAVKSKKPHGCVSLTFESCSIEITNFQVGVTKTFTIAKCFDEKPILWPAFRVLLEWARTVKIVKSGGSEGMMTVIAFCCLFIEFSQEKPIEIAQTYEPYTIGRLRNWFESMNEESCGEIIMNFLKMLSDRGNKNFVATRKDPIGKTPLIKTGLIDDLRVAAETAMFILAAHDGDIQKLFQYSTKYRIFKIHKKLLDPETAQENEVKLILNDVKKKSKLMKNSNLNLKMIQKSGNFYLEVSGVDHHDFFKVETAVRKIHNKVYCVKSRGSEKAYHVKNSTIMIPEFSNGPTTEVTFSLYRGSNFQPNHTAKVRATTSIRSDYLNTNWTKTEYQRYETKFISQLKLHKDTTTLNKSKLKGSSIWRFFGSMRCVLRTGDQYYFQVPDTLMNTFESLQLERIERMISAQEMSFEKEKFRDLAEDTKRNRVLTLFELPKETPNQYGTVELQPMRNVKNYEIQEMRSQPECFVVSKIGSNASKKCGGLRNSFFSVSNKTPDEVKQFANANGFISYFSSVKTNASISVFWRSREIILITDCLGIVQDIHHRKVRWISATFQRFRKKSADDVRAYLETKQELDDDENCLNTLKQYLDNRSIFTPDFVEKIMNENEIDYESLPQNPLIPEMFNLNWRFRAMRIIRSISDYTHIHDGDVISMKKIYDGVFNANQSFEWFEDHNELEIELDMKKRTAPQLSKASYDYSIKLFDFIKH